ncbi:muropeptide transporter [Oligella ureolytica]|uniref:MFS transporter n=1 Tax=Oligella ureolytica TaxID=90244 RepID=UPI000E02A9BE|nr:MFS transporter [Oligella ureolytica]SUA54765.1 muropeptide transporter [Oligella ureolytica]
MNWRQSDRPLMMFFMVYMTQYIGVSFVLTSAVVILRHLGFPLEKLSLLYLVTLPIAFKIFFGIMVDKVKTFFQGQYRGWLLIAQAGMTSLLIVISFIDFVSHFYLVLALFIIYAVLTSIQDVSVDGLACKIFPKDKRQKVNAVQYAGNLLGNIAGGGIVLIFYEDLGWSGSLCLLAALTLFSFMQIVFYREPDIAFVTENSVPVKLWVEFKAFIAAHRQWFGFLLIMPLGLSAAYALLNPMLVDLEWAPQEIGLLTKIFGSVVGVLSAVLIIPLVSKLGRSKALALLMFLQSVVLFALLPMTRGYADIFGIYIAIGMYSLIQPGLLAAGSTVIMDKASITSSKSTFFSLQISVVVLLGFFYSALALRLAHYYGYYVVMVGAIVASFVAWGLLVLLLRVSRKNGRDFLSE